MKAKVLSVAAGVVLALNTGVAGAEFAWYSKVMLGVQSGDQTDDTLDLVGTGSRIGINASENLGEGLTVNYFHEWGINTGDGVEPGNNGAGTGDTANFGHRDNLLSVTGAFGTAGAGVIATPTKAIGAGKLDLFPDTVGDTNANPLVSAAGASDIIRQPSGGQIRYGNSLRDVSFLIAYGLEQGVDNASFIDGNVFFAAGPVEVGIGFFSGGDGTAGEQNFDTLLNVALGYKFRNMTLMGGFQSVSGLGHGNDDETAITAGAVIPFGANEFKVQFTSGNADDDSEGDLLALGIERKISRTFTVGAHFATFSPAASGLDDASGLDVTASMSF